jgi:hypothetical protein
LPSISVATRVCSVANASASSSYISASLSGSRRARAIRRARRPAAARPLAALEPLLEFAHRLQVLLELLPIAGRQLVAQRLARRPSDEIEQRTARALLGLRPQRRRWACCGSPNKRANTARGSVSFATGTLAVRQLTLLL